MPEKQLARLLASPRVVQAVALLVWLPLAQAEAQDQRLIDRLPQETVAQLEPLIDSAAQGGLPTEPLVQKALEGQSKGAEGARIVAAVRGLLGQLRGASTALGPAASDADLVAGAACLRAGASPDMLQEIHRLRPGQSVAVPLGVLSDLVSLGVEVPRAWQAVRSVAEAKGPDADFLALRDQVGNGRSQPPPDPNRPRLIPSPNRASAP
jgi:hypothetical protein